MKSEPSKAKTAAFALKTSWENYMHESEASPSCDKTNIRLSAMRKTAIDTISQTGYADASVYDSLEKSYINNAISAEPDYEEINKAINALAAINTEESVRLLYIFLWGLHQNKCAGKWGKKEKTIFPWIVNSLCLTYEKSKSIWNLLVIIFRTQIYSYNERLHVKNALVKINAAASTGVLAASQPVESQGLVWI